MLTALISVTKVFPNEQERYLILEGESVGEIRSGIQYLIPLNHSLNMSVPICDVVCLSSSVIQLRMDFEGWEDFIIVNGMNICDEVLEIHVGESLFMAAGRQD